MNRKRKTHLHIVFGIAIAVAILIQAGGAADLPTSPLPDSKHITIATTNGGPFYIKFDGGGINAMHITTSTDEPYGQVTTTSSSSGYFYISDTGGRGFFNDVLLLIAIRKPEGANQTLPEDLSITIRASGYRWTSTGVLNMPPAADAITYISESVRDTVVLSDLRYGPQKWKPAGNNDPLNYPIYYGQDMNDVSDQFYLAFVDLKAGMLGVNSGLSGLTDNGMIRVEYTINNLGRNIVAFNTYGWCDENQANQGEGISWTNRVAGVGSSGYLVVGDGSGTGDSHGTTSISTGGGDSDSDNWIPDVGDLTVTSVPAGALVFIDGEETGELTNTTFVDLPAGEEYAITVMLEDYETPPIDWVRVNRGSETTKHFDLTLSCGSCRVESVPAGADIFVDGVDTLWHTNGTISDIEVGNHTITVVREGYGAVERQIEIRKDECPTVRVTLESLDDQDSAPTVQEPTPLPELPSPTSLPVIDGNSTEDESEPGLFDWLFDWLGSIFPVQTVDVPETVTYSTPDTLPVPAGESNTTILEAGPHIEVPEGEPPSQAGEEDNALGGLYITSFPKGCAISIDGKSTGYSTPNLLFGLKAGRHLVRVTRVSETGTDMESVSEYAWVYPDECTAAYLSLDQGAQSASVNLVSNDFASDSFVVDGEFPEYQFPSSVTVKKYGSFINIEEMGKYYSVWLDSVENGQKIKILKDAHFGTLEVNSNPGGAVIYIDGFVTGKTTPALIENVSDGYHVIQVSKKGFLPERAEIRMLSARRNVDESVTFDLEEYTHGTLLVESDPSGLKIYLDGRYTGKTTPYEFDYVPIGTIDVGLMYNKTIMESTQVTIHPLDKKGVVVLNKTFPDIVAAGEI